ncbi:hypothetical protein M409DRAFT_27725 [Zasmidium cellare ATCC 36951]|uniref:Uncharacterized protein n=1 Tax=Zasmidium cellare ATCC 36951 TaxID=1080233 RepID=A0A6A6C723_ZASCE|nr:uncharacterized protein M409DRAFT_27725 [Zasmidium cellare ATCC 36951]KAF2162000.1 hypothetical protein M409DRAFT_27725 [Zasmidium cellare ATCC 36951]
MSTTGPIMAVFDELRKAAARLQTATTNGSGMEWHSHPCVAEKEQGRKEGVLSTEHNIDPQIQLSQITSMLWLGAEHHVLFRHLITAYFSSNTSSLNNAVASFLALYGPQLWPDSPKRRLHLSRPEGPSLLAYIGSNLGPAHSIHGKMSAWKRRKFLIDHEGIEPTVVEEIAECPLGMAIYRYVELLKETGLNKPDGGEHEGCEVLLEQIVGRQDGLGNGNGGNLNEEERESSPDVPLRRQCETLANQGTRG